MPPRLASNCAMRCSTSTGKSAPSLVTVGNAVRWLLRMVAPDPLSMIFLLTNGDASSDPSMPFTTALTVFPGVGTRFIVSVIYHFPHEIPILTVEEAINRGRRKRGPYPRKPNNHLLNHLIADAVN